MLKRCGDSDKSKKLSYTSTFSIYSILKKSTISAGVFPPQPIVTAMSELNYKHLRYFWMVAKTGSVSRAAAQMHLTPQSISGQLSVFETRLGAELFQRVGRNLKLTDAGQRILGVAEEIFTLGDHLVETLHSGTPRKTTPLRLGISDSISKSMAYRLIEPALGLGSDIRLVCHEGLLLSLLANLSVHRLDMIIADKPIPSNLNVRGYSHLLGESRISVFGTRQYVKQLKGKFPDLLNNARFLLPGEDVAIRPRLDYWLESQDLHPYIVGEFDDSAMPKVFGKAGAGLFVGPTALADDIREQYKVVEVGCIDSITEQYYAITTERNPTNPAIIEISKSAREVIFMNHKTPLPESVR